MTVAPDKRLRTIKKACAETGASRSFLWQLIHDGKLTNYKIQSSTYVSLAEFEALASPIQNIKTQTA